MVARITQGLPPLMRLQDEMNEIFGNMVEDVLASRGYGATYPGANVWEDGDAAYVEAELPGVSMDDVEVDVRENEVTMTGRRAIEDVQGGTYRRRERPQGAFMRVLTLPWEIDADHVEAKLRDGVLTIRLPKSESAKPRKVQVQTT